MTLRLTSMTAGLAVGITAAVALACAAGAYFYSVHHFQSLLDNERSTALGQGEVMRVALEHQMIENDRTLIAAMIKSFGEEPRVANVVLLDRTGTVRASSAPIGPAEDFQIGSPTCQACHRLPADQRGSSRVIETRGGTMLRTVIPFRNRQACYGCHDPAHHINGIMILDLDAGGMRDAMNDDLRWMVLGSGGLALLLMAVVSLSLGLINLFPFLPLDGGHIFWSLVEKVRGRPVAYRTMERAGALGFVLVIMLFALGLSNDIGRLTGEGLTSADPAATRCTCIAGQRVAAAREPPDTLRAWPPSARYSSAACRSAAAPRSRCRR